VLATIGGTLSVEGDIVNILAGAAALDRSFEALEQEIGEHVAQLLAAEKEAEKHFNRVYRQMARTLNHAERHA
jgi:hypothetical protein